jgi:hypothetical protein
LYYNTVRLDNCGSGSYALNDNYSDQLEIKNNNFDAGDKVVMYVYNPTGLIYSDYNNFSSSTIYPIFHSGYRTFASYQTYTGNDSHSLSVAPYYVSQNSYQLHDIHLNNAGSPISGITTDIEGDTRSTSTPDIGADEYTILANDAKLYAINEPDNIVVEGNVPIKLSLQNMGATSIYLITLKYQIDTGTVYAYNWSGSLAPLAIDSLILVDSANLTSGTHSIKAWTMNPNNINDLNKNNDTLSKTFQVQIIPRIIVEPSSVYETIAACDDSITVNLKVKNEGIATLTVNTVGRQANRNTTLEVLLFLLY